MDKKSIVDNILGYPGRIYGSKGQYSWDHKSHLVVFNANICTSEGKVWHGDFDVTVEEEKLMELAKALKETVYVLYEQDARFENEKNPKLDQAVYAVNADGTDNYNKEYFERSENGRLYAVPYPEPTAEEKEESRRNYLENDYCREDMYEITDFLIPWSQIKRLSKKSSPLHKFWESVGAHFKVDAKTEEGQDFLYRVRISTKDSEILKKAMTAWVEKYYDFLSEYRKNKEVDWAMFMNGPSSFLHDPEWMKPGYVYQKKAEPEAKDS